MCDDIQSDVVLHFRWSRANENLFATTGCPGKISSQLLIHHLGHPQVSQTPLTVFYVFNVRYSSSLISHTDVVTACDARLGHSRVRPQLAPDTPTLRDRRWQKTLLLDDWNVAICTALSMGDNWVLCFCSSKCFNKIFFWVSAEFVWNLIEIGCMLYLCTFPTTPSGQLQINSGLVWSLWRARFSFLWRISYISCLLCPAKRAVVQRNASRHRCQLSTSPVNMIIVLQVFCLWLFFNFYTIHDRFWIKSGISCIFGRSGPPAVAHRKSTGRLGWGNN